MYRDHTKEIQIGDKKIGGGNPVLIQSMCNTKTENVAATVEQIHRLEDAGCDIIRVAVPTMEAAAAIREIKKQIHQCHSRLLIRHWRFLDTLTVLWDQMVSGMQRWLLRNQQTQRSTTQVMQMIQILRRKTS